MKKLIKKEKGFTIIEVLIVLAIAGLILLIVFLAVPALQRNSRNTQIKNAASAVLGGITEFQNNNNGQMPTTIASAADGEVTISGGGGTSPATARVQGGYTVAAGTTMPTQTGSIVVYLNRQCNGNTFGVQVNRAVAAGFLIESQGGPTPQCVQG